MFKERQFWVFFNVIKKIQFSVVFSWLKKAVLSGYYVG